jgi:hypothetical protein
VFKIIDITKDNIQNCDNYIPTRNYVAKHVVIEANKSVEIQFLSSTPHGEPRLTSRPNGAQWIGDRWSRELISALRELTPALCKI